MSVEHIIILRATLETRSPLIIDAGEQDALSDTLFVRDANGLPMLPATSLAGVLRAAIGQQGEQNASNRANEWFGTQSGDQGSRSMVTLTDGLFHWSDNKPRDGLLLDPTELQQDPLCKAVLPGSQRLTREHVRINEHGVVDGDGKFSRDAVPTGARFSFEIRTINEDAAKELEAIIKQGLWMGGATRTGYGELACVAFGAEACDLVQDWQRWCKIAASDIGMRSLIAMSSVESEHAAGKRDWTIQGEIEGPLLIGASGLEVDQDRAPWRESRIVWKNNDGKQQGEISAPVWVIPASAIKGPIRHRALFYLRRKSTEDVELDPEKALQELFGYAAKNVQNPVVNDCEDQVQTVSGDNAETGAAGRLRFHDCVIPAETTLFKQTHVGLDRFTGGARRGVLFTDAMLWKPQLTITITELDMLTDAQGEALRLALQDMATGLCGLGADWGEGAGVFNGAKVKLRVRSDWNKGVTVPCGKRNLSKKRR